jgi:hypothetical protein
MKHMKWMLNHLLLDENPNASIITMTTGEFVHWNNGTKCIFEFTQLERLGPSLKSATT